MADFTSWLRQVVEVDVWMPSINTQANVTLMRGSFIKMTGNLSKHNFLRTFRVAKELQGVLRKSNITVTLEEANIALADFYERFHADILNYHSSTIAEFLNNIRWGIYEYLQLLFHQSIVRDVADPTMYCYTCPPNVFAPFAVQVFWDLMNVVRSPPYMRRFQVTRWLKLRY